MTKLIYLNILFLICILFACKSEIKQQNTPTLGAKGLHGYIAYDAPPSPEDYGAGVSFYTAVWPLIDQPIRNFQIGLPGTWIIPDNRDNKDIPLCPIGTLARDNWDERGPTYGSVFQTLEGGLGYWAGNKYRYGPPKFMMNATAQCYDYEIATPGWSFFYDDSTLVDERLGIAQLSNRLLIPPDALTFEGNPNGEFMGYSYMALPLTDAYGTVPPVGEQSWTCFINTQNFKGPIAYYLPETWSKVSKDYPIINGRGLDARAGIINGGAMEINTVPHYESYDQDSSLYVKIPQLYFPTDEQGEAKLVQDLTFYNKDALYNDILAWRKRDKSSNGIFKVEGALSPALSTKAPKYDQGGMLIEGIEDIFYTQIYNSTTFGLSWKTDINFKPGHFPQYFKEVDGKRIPIAEDDVPIETGLLDQSFLLEEKKPPYSSPEGGIWKSPGPIAGPYTVVLNDKSTVTYYWYRFIDQPVFQQFDWTDQKKDALQNLIEQMHQSWPIDRDYIKPPSTGQLIELDAGLLVSPPKGMESGYVPIVTRQERL